MKKATEIRTLVNYVLVKPDPHYTTYQSKGKELGLEVANFAYDKDGKRVNLESRHFSVTGTVYAVPERLQYNGHKIEAYGSNNGLNRINGETVISNRDLLDKLDDLRLRSLQFDTKIELSKGDRIRFSYLAHSRAKEMNLVLDTDEGEMILIKYDQIFMVIDENRQPKKLINGHILIKPEMKEVKEEESGVEYTESPSGLMLPVLKSKEKRTKKGMLGECVLCGKPVKGYLQFPGISDNDYDIPIGDKILFDSRIAMRLEPMLHQEHEEVYYLIQRRAVLSISSENVNFASIQI